MKKIFVALSLLFSVSSSMAFAATVQEMLDAGFGPVLQNRSGTYSFEQAGVASEVLYTSVMKDQLVVNYFGGKFNAQEGNGSLKKITNDYLRQDALLYSNILIDQSVQFVSPDVTPNHKIFNETLKSLIKAKLVHPDAFVSVNHYDDIEFAVIFDRAVQGYDIRYFIQIRGSEDVYVSEKLSNRS